MGPTIHHKIGFDPYITVSTGSRAPTKRNDDQSAVSLPRGENGEDLRNHWEVRPFRSGNVSLLNREDQERRIALSRTGRTNDTTDAHTICNTIQAKLDRSKKSRFPK